MPLDTQLQPISDFVLHGFRFAYGSGPPSAAIQFRWSYMVFETSSLPLVCPSRFHNRTSKLLHIGIDRLDIPNALRSSQLATASLSGLRFGGATLLPWMKLAKLCYYRVLPVSSACASSDRRPTKPEGPHHGCGRVQGTHTCVRSLVPSPY
ncbi:hypothetical protein PHMEG_0009099 [Phytophthora megakarya]|uniref:Uncharacterized protein n=1 Tax=Phytophthora megakarya TaxID=4795 RepID=A0A225WH23_9STRA|nr:hypothetical protein PHMEG_0009099 [Phytophthora megakarya]